MLLIFFYNTSKQQSESVTPPTSVSIAFKPNGIPNSSTPPNLAIPSEGPQTTQGKLRRKHFIYKYFYYFPCNI